MSFNPASFCQPQSSSNLGGQQAICIPNNVGAVHQYPVRPAGNGNHLTEHNNPTNPGIPGYAGYLANNHPPPPQQQHSPNSWNFFSHTTQCHQWPPASQDIMGTGDTSRIQNTDDFSPRDRLWNINNTGTSIPIMPSYSFPLESTFSVQNLISSANPALTPNPVVCRDQPPAWRESAWPDLSEFPSLTKSVVNSNMSRPQHQWTSSPGRQPYVGMVKQSSNETNEFRIVSEDFPALPDSRRRQNPEQATKSDQGKSSTTHFPNKASQPQKSGIQISDDGHATNIPPGILKDQFGMLGLLSFIHTTESDPDLASLALGMDLTTLGLNLNTSEALRNTFGGPWAEHPLKPQDMEYPVPSEYIINHSIKDKLAPLSISQYGDELLFFLFYICTGEAMQVMSAKELYNRDWRFHKEEMVWITRIPGMALIEKTATSERGMYYFFDPENWKKVPKEFHLDYDSLEEMPKYPL